MGRTRNQRARKEGTFLEHVSDCLRSLSAEIVAIRNVIEKIHNVDVVNGAAVILPPPAPPPLDVFDRSFLLRARCGCMSERNSANVLSANVSLPVAVSYIGVASDRNKIDDISEFLVAAGNYEFEGDTQSTLVLDEVEVRRQSVKMAQYNAFTNRKREGEAILRIQSFWRRCKLKSRPNQLDSNIAGAQEEALGLREAEQLGNRMTYEAMKADAARGGLEIPAVLTNEILGDYVLTHVEIACSTSLIENRRPYLQQQIYKLEKKHTLSEEAGNLIVEILDRYAPSHSFNEELPCMCSHCGALYKQDAATQCEACQGYDICEMSECRNKWDTSSESSDDLAAMGSASLANAERSPALSLKQTSFPEFMRNVNYKMEVGTDSESKVGEKNVNCNERGSALVAGHGAVSIEPSPPIEAAQICSPSNIPLTKTSEQQISIRPNTVYNALRGGPCPGVYTTWEEAKK